MISPELLQAMQLLMAKPSSPNLGELIPAQSVIEPKWKIFDDPKNPKYQIHLLENAEELSDDIYMKEFSNRLGSLQDSTAAEDMRLGKGTIVDRIRAVRAPKAQPTS